MNITVTIKPHKTRWHAQAKCSEEVAGAIGNTPELAAVAALRALEPYSPDMPRECRCDDVEMFGHFEGCPKAYVDRYIGGKVAR